MHTLEKTLALLSAALLAFSLTAAHAASLPPDNAESEGEFDDVLSEEESDGFEEFLQERQAEEEEASGGRTLEEAVHGSDSGSGLGSGSWNPGTSSTLDSWSADSSTAGSSGGMEGFGRAVSDSGYAGGMSSGDLVSDFRYSAPARPGPASSVVEEFSAIGGEIQPRGNADGASERYGVESDSFNDSNPFDDSPDSEASSVTDLGWISERNSDPDSTGNQQTFGTQIWTSQPDSDEENTFAPEPRGERNTRSRGNATPAYLLD